MKVNSDNKHPIKSWCPDVELGAVEQANHLANLPFLYKHVALMPDCHQGYGMPIGGVIALDTVIIPNAVGVDIGCGMCACQTPFTDVSQATLKRIISEIQKQIPLGKNHHETPQDECLLPSTCYDVRERNDYFPVITGQWDSILHQIGTLGGGNHFIELQKGSDGFIWIMLHSGSRNIGKRVADHYNSIAEDKNNTWYSSVDPRYQLAFLPMETDEAQAYWHEMTWCIKFAKVNRQLMMSRIQTIVDSFWNEFTYSDYQQSHCWKTLDIAHNYAAWENHFGQNVVVHRKGATRARKGDIGIIPGSQGTKSYIVEGLGNPESFMSCSHGAGRAMSRTKARDELSLEVQKQYLDERGIIHSIRNVNDLDEAPGAYKDIDIVMENQKDLVKPIVELTPLAVIKGD